MVLILGLFVLYWEVKQQITTSLKPEVKDFSSGGTSIVVELGYGEFIWTIGFISLYPQLVITV